MTGKRPRWIRRVTSGVIGGSLLGLVLASEPAHAASRLLVETFNETSQSFSDNVERFLALDLAFATQVDVTVMARSTLIVQFAAVCVVRAGDAVSSALVEILVDSIRLGLNRALCTSVGQTTTDRGVGAVAQASIVVDPGTHVIQVLAKGVEIGTGESYTIDDLSLVVSRDHVSPLQ
ncbi:MAG: hypothetical protein ACREMB_06965 [Candidatus Rokuibacteriota bacterium]